MTPKQIAKKVEGKISENYIEGLAQRLMSSPNVNMSDFLTANKDDRIELIEEEIEGNSIINID